MKSLRVVSTFLILLLSATFVAAEDTSLSIGGKILISGEGGLSFFHAGKEGDFKHNEFLVDEGKLFVEASLGAQTYFYSETNFLTREASDDHVEIGELYIDFENLSRFWNSEGVLNVRVGRMDIPFGEEYLTRDAIDNPLISHSITDFWGVDEGVEVYGASRDLHYAFAIQNGGIPKLHDFTSDKSVCGRVTYDVVQWLHLGFSAMRTGALDPTHDVLSALWFGNGFVRSLGSPATTNFRANLYLAEGEFNWNSGHFTAGGGQLHYSDNDPNSNNDQTVSYYQFEAMERFIEGPRGKLYGAARFGKINSPDGFPIAEHGDFGHFFFSPNALTTDIWRFTAGLGYRPNANILLKAEYTAERGTLFNGAKRNHEDFWGAEVALKF